jgi:hypothetical protein
MRFFDLIPSHTPVTEFVAWRRHNALLLNPPFQRRSVWKSGARSYFIDTLIRGLPVPLVFLRERLDVGQQDIVREVVDGQQRLRTVLGFIDEKLISDFNPVRDRFTVMPEHNPDPTIAGKRFRDLPEDIRSRILKYRFSIQILPADMEDRDVLQVFARLNSTGLRLTPQELRNAEWFGKFKTSMFELAYEQFERWLNWRIFSPDQVSRMQEVELVSDLVVNMMKGLTAKNQQMLDDYYKKYDVQFPESEEVGRRFRLVMDSIDDLYGSSMPRSAYSRVMHFFTLFVYLYDRQFGLGTSLKRSAPKPISQSLRPRLEEASKRFIDRRLPKSVLQAVSGAATDLSKRKTRLQFLRSILDAKSS